MLLFIPFILQGGAMFFDEFIFHRKRGLPMWERVGHPLDTLTVLLCYLLICLVPYSEINLNIYIGFSAFSCLFVTKDEFVHTEHCTAQENWLHAILFVLHPLTFLAAGIIWKENLYPSFIALQPIVIFAFLIYQLLYWSPFANTKQKSK
jgi:hypothetical protein